MTINININTTKLPKLDKIIPFCKVISLGSGSAPKYVTVELPTHDGARIKVWWTGAPIIAVDDYVRVQRQGADKRYIIIGTDRSTPDISSVWPGYAKIKLINSSGITEYDNDLAQVASDAVAGDVVLIGPAAQGDLDCNGVVFGDEILITGTGKSITNLVGTNVDRTLTLGNNCILLNMTVFRTGTASNPSAAIYTPSGDFTLHMENVQAENRFDVTDVNTYAIQLDGGGYLFNCGGFASKDTGINDGDIRGFSITNVTTPPLRLIECEFAALRIGGGAGNDYGAMVSLTGGTAVIRGGVYSGMDASLSISAAGIVLQNPYLTTSPEITGSTVDGSYYDVSGDLVMAGDSSIIIPGGGVLAFDSSLTDEYIYNPSDGNIDIVVEGETGLRVDAGVGVILPLANRDVYVLGDTEIGLGGRFVQGYTVEDHFVGTAIDAAWTWAGAPFATPGEASMTAIASCLQLAFTSGTDPRGFLYRTDSLTTTVRVVGLAFNNPTDLTFCGYRFDDSSDNNYVEVAIRKTSGAGTWQLISRYRTGGGAVTTTVHYTINDIPKFVGCRLQVTGTQWSNWNVLAAIGIDSPAVSITQFVSGLTWTPTRRGICFTSIGSPPGSFQGPYVDWVS